MSERLGIIAPKWWKLFFGEKPVKFLDARIADVASSAPIELAHLVWPLCTECTDLTLKYSVEIPLSIFFGRL